MSYRYDPKTKLPEVTWRKLDLPESKLGDVHEALRFAVYIGLGGSCAPEDQDGVVEGVLDALIAHLPVDCPSGLEWTAIDIENWLLAVKEGRA